MKLSKYEQKTIIGYNEEEVTASFYTHNKKLIQKLKRLSEKYPDKVKPERPEHTLRKQIMSLLPRRFTPACAGARFFRFYDLRKEKKYGRKK